MRKEINTMQKRTRTSINTLSVIGYELPEEHLRLAAGAGPIDGTLETSFTRNGRRIVDQFDA
jgi:hypothetical protein